MGDYKLGIVIDNKRDSKFRLSPGVEVVIGKKPNHTNSIVVHHPNVSRQHAQLMMNGDGHLYIVDLGSMNGTFVNGRQIEANVPYQINERDAVSFVKGSDIKLVFNPDDFKPIGSQDLSPLPGELQTTDIKGLLEKKRIVMIGRDPSCDIVLQHQTISKNHAVIEHKSDGNYYLKDLNSTNGTFLNGKRLKGEARVTELDLILIGRFVINLKGKAKNLSDEITVKVDRIVKDYPNGYRGLNKSTFEIPSHSLLAVMGPSGCGKSTLLKAICGDSPATGGSVYLFGLELNSNYDFLKTQIGYVPQDDIVHKELTVEQSLYFAAKLRLQNATESVIEEKIEQVLKELNITHIRNSLVGKISGGQRKRVSIAVEILTDPMVLFLDEPTSPLDPQTIEEFLGILKNLAEKGTTVVMVTHKPDDLEFMDDVIFMAEGGYIAYHGDVDTYRSHFNVKHTRDVYKKLEQPEAKIWIERYTNSHPGETTGAKAPNVKGTGATNWFSQYRWLTQRYLNIKLNDRMNTLVMIGQAPIIALLICIIFSKVSIAVPFLMAISAIWFGTNNAAREIVGELPIYKRERMFNQGIFPYILSKLTVLGAFAAMQSLMFTLIITLFYFRGGEDAVAWNDPIMTFLWMLIISISASLMGLLLSAVVSTTEKVMTIVPIALIPQIMLAGVITPIKNPFVEWLSYLTLSRWGTEGFSVIQGNVVGQTAEISMKEGTGVFDETVVPPVFIEPEFNEPIMKDTIVNAANELQGQFHESYEAFGSLQGTLRLDMLVVFILSFILFAGIVIALKKKDPIKIR